MTKEILDMEEFKIAIIKEPIILPQGRIIAIFDIYRNEHGILMKVATEYKTELDKYEKENSDT